MVNSDMISGFKTRTGILEHYLLNFNSDSSSSLAARNYFVIWVDLIRAKVVLESFKYFFVDCLSYDTDAAGNDIPRPSAQKCRSACQNVLNGHCF